ncbi:MAG: hypothetical protein OXF98_02995, partial [Rhodospirillaceae bacterium]|nr:hypothetical protein [Rhodospirillaceae bacterium]
AARSGSRAERVSTLHEMAIDLDIENLAGLGRRNFDAVEDGWQARAQGLVEDGPEGHPEIL